MKRLFITFLVMIMVVPAFLQAMPHGVDHALHKTQNHNIETLSKHSHRAHDDNHHVIPLDIVTFYDEYLHADLQLPEHRIIEAPAQDVESVDLNIITNAEPILRYELSSVQSRAPPDWQSFQSPNTPLYLSTRRLRI